MAVGSKLKTDLRYPFEGMKTTTGTVKTLFQRHCVNPLDERIPHCEVAKQVDYGRGRWKSSPSICGLHFASKSKRPQVPFPFHRWCSWSWGAKRLVLYNVLPNACRVVWPKTSKEEARARDMKLRPRSRESKKFAKRCVYICKWVCLL